jgi:hypothetical protein
MTPLQLHAQCCGGARVANPAARSSQDEVDYADVALLGLRREHPLRATAIRLVTYKYYESFTLALIVASCTTLAMDSTRQVWANRQHAAKAQGSGTAASGSARHEPPPCIE